MIGADLVAEAFKAHSITFVSTLIGNGIDPVLMAARRAGLRIVDTHNEQTAAHMADSYARLTGRIGVCAVSSSVGFTNALIGAVNARFDGAPMLLIAGASDHAYAGRGSFQDFDQVSAAAPIFKYARIIDRADKIPFIMHDAIAAATSGRPGPVHLTIPLDVLNTQVHEATARPPLSAAGAVHPCGAGDQELVQQAARAIASARRPLLIAGSGAFYAQVGEALASFTAQTAMPVMTPIWDRGCITSSLPQFMGVIGAASGSPPILERADLIIMLGSRVDYRVGYLQPPAVDPDARIIRISADPDELRQGVEPDIAIQGDPRAVLAQLSLLMPAAPSAAQGDWLREARQCDDNFRARWHTPLSAGGGSMTGRQLVEALRPYVNGDNVFVVDGGNIGQWVHMLLCDRYPGHWLTCGASGVIGFGLGGAMAARLAYPDRPVLLLSGDGSMGFNLADWESAVRQALPFVAIVADDQAWGIVVSGQKRRQPGEVPVACRLGPIRFAAAADACGALGLEVSHADEIEPAIEQALASGRPSLIHVPIAQGGPAD